MTNQKDDEPEVELSSPVCAMEEADDAYMGYAGKDELISFLTELLEAERAGARVAFESARAARSDRIAELLRTIQRDEARWCGMLLGHIETLGEVSSRQVGAFYGKAMAISDVAERIRFLNRGQGWVVRKLRQMLPRVRNDGLHADLSEMLRSHEANIALANDAVATSRRGLAGRRRIRAPSCGPPPVTQRMMPAALSLLTHMSALTHGPRSRRWLRLRYRRLFSRSRF